jgi:hypothetical protein
VFVKLDSELMLIRFGGHTVNDEYLGLYFQKVTYYDSEISFLGWEKKEEKGVPAPPRVDHTLSYVRKINSLILVGGKNDREQFGIGEIHMFYLDNMAWSKVTVSGDPFLKIYGHTAVLDNETIYLVGGFLHNASTDICYGSNRIS